MKRNLLISLGIGIFFLALVFYNISLREIIESFKRIKVIYLFPILLLFTFLQIVRTYRWGFILKKEKRVGFRSLFSMNSIGFMAINILPLRLGEFARPYLLVEKEDIPFGSGLASIVVERVFDMMSVMLIFLFAVLSIELPVSTLSFGNFEVDISRVTSGVKIFIVAGLLPVISLFILLLVFRDRFLRLVEIAFSSITKRAGERIIAFLQKFIDNLSVFKRPIEIIYLFSLSLSIWFLTGVSVLLFCISFGFTNIDIWDSLFILTLTMVGIAIPAPPGFAGNFEAFCVAGLMVFGISKQDSSAFALLLHFSQLIYIVILGIYFLMVDKVSFKNIIGNR